MTLPSVAKKIWYIEAIMPFEILWPVILFLCGTFGVMFSRLNLLIALMCLEVMLLGVNMFILYLSLDFNILEGMLVSLIILLIGAAETALGLALLVNTYKTRW